MCARQTSLKNLEGSEKHYWRVPPKSMHVASMGDLSELHPKPFLELVRFWRLYTCHKICWIDSCCVPDACGTKRHRPADPEAPAGMRLKDNLVNLYAGGDVAGDRAQSLLEDPGVFAEECGRHELQDLRASKSPGAARNISRDRRRRKLRRSHWPPIYMPQKVGSSCHMRSLGCSRSQTRLRH